MQSVLAVGQDTYRYELAVNEREEDATICIYIWLSLSFLKHLSIYLSVYLYVCVCVYMHVCMYVCMYTYIHTYIHTYMYMYIYI